MKHPLRVIRDGLKAHRNRLVREYPDSLDGHIQIAFLPPYAPDLNPVEYLWRGSNGTPRPATAPTI